MKRVLCVLSILSILFTSVLAQKKTHFVIGPTISHFLNAENARPKVGLFIGFRRDYHLYKNLSFSAGLNLASRGAILENRTSALCTSESKHAGYPDRSGRLGYAATSSVVQNEKLSSKQMKKSKLLLSVGTNLSSYPGEEGRWQWGYSIGLTFNIINIHENLSMILSFYYDRINTALKNVEGRTYTFLAGENIYKTLSDLQVSIVHIEAPLLFSYKILTKNKYDISYILGAGIAIGIKDFSRVEKFTRTDEIIGVEQLPFPSGIPYELKDGWNIITGVRFHVDQLYLDLFYTLYPYNVKDINRLNSISLKLGIDISNLKRIDSE